MKWIFACLALMIAGQVQAQQVDQQIVHNCFANAAAGDVAPSCLGQASNTCQMLGYTTTLGITLCIQAETQVWDDLLNSENKAVRGYFANRDAGSTTNALDLSEHLLNAQRAWIAFRDAECALAYARWQDGSIRSIVNANCRLVMTATRAIELRDMKGN